MTTTPAPLGPSRGSPPAGGSDPDTSLPAEFSEGVPPPVTVSWAQLGSLLDLSERSIREHRAQGHVVRSGSGYDVRRSVLGMLDWLRVEAAKKGLGEAGEPLWKSYEVVLAHRRELLEEVRRLRAAFIAKSKQGRERPE